MDLLLRDCGFHHGKSWHRQYLGTSTYFLGNEPACRSIPASGPSQELQEPLNEKLDHRFGSTRRSIRKQRDISRTMAHPTINADETLKAHDSPCLPRTGSMLLRDGRAQVVMLG